jgi:hypothetical protein
VGGRFSTLWLWTGVLSVGCTTLAGLDQDYVREESIEEAGGSAGTGVGSAGGLGGEGGTGSIGGLGGADGVGAASGAAGASGASGANGASTAGGAGSVGGAVGAGGTDPPDAAGGSAGSAGTDSADSGPTCAQGEKRCGDVCVKPSVSFGCSLADCTPCPDAAPNTEVFCGEQRCEAKCLSGFVPSGGQCVPQNSVDGGGGNAGSAGTAGAGGRGGSGGIRQCNVDDCPSCSIFRGQACCTFFRTCGCSFVGAFFCI